MLFAIGIRNRYWSRTCKIVDLILYAHRYRKIVSNIRYALTNHAENIDNFRVVVISSEIAYKVGASIRRTGQPPAGVANLFGRTCQNVKNKV